MFCLGRQRPRVGRESGWIPLILLLVSSADAQCGFTTLDQMPDILKTCCENTNATDCSKGFPKFCTLECAKLLVPFYNRCHRTLAKMSSDNMHFKVRELKGFTQSCEHTQLLLHYTTDERVDCAANPEEKQQRVKDVTAACCHQKGQFVCKSEVPWLCNAECATSYVPFFDQCVETDRAINVQQMQKYTTLYETCANLDQNQLQVLVSDVNTLIDNPKCKVNTTGIMTSKGKFTQHFIGVKQSCRDDDASLRKVFGNGATCFAAAQSKRACKMGAAKWCTCSCKTEKPPPPPAPPPAPPKDGGA